MNVKIFKKILAITLIFIWVLSPVVPVLRVTQTEEGEKIKLGIEVSKAEAQFSSGYSYRRTITIQESQVTGGSNLTNFPVLMSFTEPELRTTGNGGNVTDAQGDDIIFSLNSQGTTLLDFERERYTPTTGEIIAWVEIPTLDFDDNTVVYMFYGNSSVTSSQENVAGTWDTTYDGVWHMDDSGSTNVDSAGTANNGTVSGATAGAVGKIGPAYDFDGINDVSTVTDAAILDYTNTATFEAWVRTDDVSTAPSFSTLWVSQNAPDGAGASDWSGVDSVIIGETEYFAGLLCADTVATFRTATRPLGTGDLSAWTSRTATGTPANTGGCDIGVDSDGVYIWHVVMSSDAGTNTRIAYATSTLDYTGWALASWKSLNNLTTLAGAAEGSSIDIVVSGERAYFAVLLLNGTTEAFRTGSVQLDGSGWTGWTSQSTTNMTGGTGESCSVGIDTDGAKLYYSGHCHSGTTSTYGRAWSNFDGTGFSGWQNDTDPAAGVAGDTEFNQVDSTIVGGFSYHAFYGHESVDENWVIASSSPQGGSVSSWIVSSSSAPSLPDGAGAVESSVPSVESDGKNIYYGAYAHNTATELFQVSSTTLPAHPFVSKRNAYELIQTGPGYVFDWAGKPTTFGSTTAASTFYHVAVTHSGSVMRYFINGQEYSSTTVTTDFATNANDLLFGQGHRANGSTIFFNGILDEIRVSSSTQSIPWIQTGYNNQNSTSTFYTISAQEENDVLPTVTTNFATPGFDSANLHGVKTGGTDGTEHGFAYSTNATLSSGVSTTTLGALLGNHAFSNYITGLSPSQVYYYRAYVTNGAGTGFGTINSFTTGNSNVSRNIRLFGTMKFLNGRAIVHQQ